MKKKQIGLNIFFIIMCILFVIPFWLVVSVSFSNETDVITNGYAFFPQNFDLAAYKQVFKNPEIVFDAYKITIIFSVVGTVLSTFLCCLIAYPLSRKEYTIRKYVSFYLFFTMLFSGGLVPTYILITKYLSLQNTIWVYILPSIISPWNVFLVRSAMQGIPNEVCESAQVDGANEFLIFGRIMLPMVKPTVATIALLTFLGKWNSWMESMLYVDKTELQSLQYMLQKLLKNIELLRETSSDATSVISSGNMAEMPMETTRMAMAVVVAGPALVIFPFFQKYFSKGIAVGSVKG